MGPVASLSIAHRNAASVLPEPVGATTSALSPWPIAAQACTCAGVGSANAAENQALVGAEKPSIGCVRAGDMAGMLPSCLLATTIAPAGGERGGRPSARAGAFLLAAGVRVRSRGESAEPDTERGRAFTRDPRPGV